VAAKAQEQGLAAVSQTPQAIRKRAECLIAAARRSVEVLMQAGVIASPTAG
jgi:hypothetical protein